MSRTSRRNEQRDARVLEALKAGNTREAAASYGGYGKTALYRYLKEDPEFCQQVELAETEAEVSAVAVVLAAVGSGAWRAAAWWLERRRPKAYAKDAVDEREEKDQVAIILPHNFRDPLTPGTRIVWDDEVDQMKKGG